jgi:hypothetical protein
LQPSRQLGAWTKAMDAIRLALYALISLVVAGWAGAVLVPVIGDSGYSDAIAFHFG